MECHRHVRLSATTVARQDTPVSKGRMGLTVVQVVRIALRVTVHLIHGHIITTEDRKRVQLDSVAACLATLVSGAFMDPIAALVLRAQQVNTVHLALNLTLTMEDPKHALWATTAALLATVANEVATGHTVALLPPAPLRQTSIVLTEPSHTITMEDPKHALWATTAALLATVANRGVLELTAAHLEPALVSTVHTVRGHITTMEER